MGVIDAAFSANETIANGYDARRARMPQPRLAIVTCTDPRLTELLSMLGLAADDADLLRNAGGVVDGDAVRSLAVSTRVLDIKEIMIVGHSNCTMQTFADSDLAARLPEGAREAGRPARFSAFTDLDANVREQIARARAHPWIPDDVQIRGFVFDVTTARLREVVPVPQAVPA